MKALMKAHWKPFVLGLAAGIVLTSGLFALGARRMRRGMREGPRIEHMLRFLTKRLDLSAEQQGKVRSVLEDKRAKLEAMRAEAAPRFEALRKEGQAEIRAVLTPEQQARFDALESQWEKRRPRGPRGFGPPHPPPGGPG